MTNLDPNRDKKVHGTSKVTETPAKKGGMGWLLWLLAALVLLALLFLLLRSCGHRAAVAPVAAVPAVVGQATPPVGVQKITLPGGATVDLAPNTLNYELQRYLASTEPTPRRFTFDHLNFATDSAVMPADAQATVSALAQILTAYPRARVELQGYADSTGADPHNIKLGADRASAVAQALVAQGVAAGRVKSLTGGSSNPVDTNATAQGRAENRRTELVLTAK